MERTNVYLPRSLKLHIRTKAQQSKTSDAVVIREAIDLGLRTLGPRPSMLEQLEQLDLTGPADLSTNLDDYLYGDRK